MNPLCSIESFAPVNFQAAKLLFKAPWWAKYHENAKKALSEIKESITLEVFVDRTKPNPSQYAEDRRGCIIQWEDGQKAVVTGFSHSTEKERIRMMKCRPKFWVGEFTPRRVSKKEIAHWWWIIKNGKFEIIKWGSPCDRNWREMCESKEAWHKGPNNFAHEFWLRNKK